MHSKVRLNAIHAHCPSFSRSPRYASSHNLFSMYLFAILVYIYINASNFVPFLKRYMCVLLPIYLYLHNIIIIFILHIRIHTIDRWLTSGSVDRGMSMKMILFVAKDVIRLLILINFCILVRKRNVRNFLSTMSCSF